MKLHTKKLQPYAHIISAVIKSPSCGENLAQSLIMAISVRSPHDLWPHLANLLWAFVMRFFEENKKWLFDALSSHELAAACRAIATEASGGKPNDLILKTELSPAAREIFLTSVYKLASEEIQIRQNNMHYNPRIERQSKKIKAHFKDLVNTFCKVARGTLRDNALKEFC